MLSSLRNNLLTENMQHNDNLYVALKLAYFLVERKILLSSHPEFANTAVSIFPRNFGTKARGNQLRPNVSIHSRLGPLALHFIVWLIQSCSNSIRPITRIIDSTGNSLIIMILGEIVSCFASLIHVS